MTTHKLVPILFFFACLGSAQGQVYKCISNGKTIFSDAPCPSNSSGNLIQERQSSEEKYNERLRALEAEQLKQQRRQIEMERNFYERPQEPTIIRHQYQNLPPPPETWAERNERRNREVSRSSITNNGGKWDQKAEAERKLAAKKHADHVRQNDNSPRNITSCDSGGCWDDRGDRYNGSGPTLFRSDGKICNQVGTMLSCN